MSAIYYPGPVLELPWSAGEGDEQRFKRLLKIFTGIFLLMSVLVPFIPVPELGREEQEKLPDNLARLLLEEQVVPEPVIEVPEPPAIVEEIPEEILTPEPEVLEEPEPVVEPEPVIVEKPPAAQLVEKARERASVSGLLQFKDDLQEMRDMLNVETIATADLRSASSAETEVKRDLISSNSSATSGGITTNNISVDAGGVALSGKENTQVDSSLALPGGVGSEQLYQEDAGLLGNTRSEEEMRRVMDANKSAIFAIYNRALRSDPTLEGKLAVQMTIDPDGFITLAVVVDSQLDDLELEDRLLTRIRLIQFPAGEYAVTTLNQTFDFLPY